MENEIEHKFLDLNIPRKGKFLQNHQEGSNSGNTTPFFSLIEFNLSGLCNRTCVFCPRSNPEVFPNINEHIPIQLFEKVMKELSEVEYDGMILFSGFGEPLLHKNLEALIRMAKNYCPNTRIETVTDGDFVTPDKLRSLFNAGLDSLLISLYDGPDQMDIFNAMREEVGLTESQIVLRKRWLPPEENYGITLVNRSGMVEIPEVGVGPLEEPMKRRCYYPFYQVVVNYDGAVLLCTHDWGKKLVVGNLNNNTIHELWDNKAMRRVRLRLAEADRNFAPCNLCDADGTLMGEAHFQQWMTWYGKDRLSGSETSQAETT